MISVANTFCNTLTCNMIEKVKISFPKSSLVLLWPPGSCALPNDSSNSVNIEFEDYEAITKHTHRSGSEMLIGADNCESNAITLAWLVLNGSANMNTTWYNASQYGPNGHEPQ